MIDASTTPVALAALVDFSTFPAASGGDLMGLTARRITGGAVVCEWVARSWLCRRGALKHARGRGVDLRQLRNTTADRRKLEDWRHLLIAEARKTPFVASSAVAIGFADRTYTVNGRLILVDGGVYPMMVSLGGAAQILVQLPGAAAA